MSDSMQSVFEIMLEGAKTRIQRRNSPELFQMLAAEVTGSEMANTREAMAEINKALAVYNAKLDAVAEEMKPIPMADGTLQYPGATAASTEQLNQAKADFEFAKSVWGHYVKPHTP